MIIINVTPSMPIGIYCQQKGPIERGDIVLACPITKYIKVGINKNYLISGKMCKRFAPLIKKVIAVPGDTVILADQYILVNDLIYNYRTLTHDANYQPLNKYIRGKYNHGYWLIGTSNERSWDSRYFGPVEKKQILSKLKPILIF